MLPPELVAKLNECAGADYVGLRDAALFWQVEYSRMVIAGLLIEGPELIHELASILDKWFPRIIERFPRFGWVVSSKRFIECAKIAAFVGWIFIIWGLIGELRASSRIVDFSARIAECSDAKVTKATLEAGDAAASAKTAHDEADAVSKETDALKLRLKAASKQQDMLEQRVSALVPRWYLLKEGKADFIGALNKFHGQRIILMPCVPETDDSEPEQLIEALSEFLGPDGAGWVVELGDAASGWCSFANRELPLGAGGNLVIFSPTANDDVRHSAEALEIILNTLNINTRIPPRTRGNMAIAIGGDSPWAFAETKPTAVILLVGNPMFDLTRRKKRRK